MLVKICRSLSLIVPVKKVLLIFFVRQHFSIYFNICINDFSIFVLSRNSLLAKFSTFDAALKEPINIDKSRSAFAFMLSANVDRKLSPLLLYLKYFFANAGHSIKKFLFYYIK